MLANKYMRLGKFTHLFSILMAFLAFVLAAITFFVDSKSSLLVARVAAVQIAGSVAFGSLSTTLKGQGQTKIAKNETQQIIDIVKQIIQVDTPLCRDLRRLKPETEFSKFLQGLIKRYLRRYYSLEERSETLSSMLKDWAKWTTNQTDPVFLDFITYALLKEARFLDPKLITAILTRIEKIYAHDDGEYGASESRFLSLYKGYFQDKKRTLMELVNLLYPHEDLKETAILIRNGFEALHARKEAVLLTERLDKSQNSLQMMKKVNSLITQALQDRGINIEEYKKVFYENMTKNVTREVFLFLKQEAGDPKLLRERLEMLKSDGKISLVPLKKFYSPTLVISENLIGPEGLIKLFEEDVKEGPKFAIAFPIEIGSSEVIHNKITASQQIELFFDEFRGILSIKEFVQTLAVVLKEPIIELIRRAGIVWLLDQELSSAEKRAIQEFEEDFKAKIRAHGFPVVDIFSYSKIEPEILAKLLTEVFQTNQQRSREIADLLIKQASFWESTCLDRPDFPQSESFL